MILDATTIVITIITMLMGIIAYFLQSIYADFKENKKDNQAFKSKITEDLGKLKGQIELTQQEQRLKHEQIEKQTQLEIKSLATEVTRLTNTVEKLIKYKESE